MTGFRFRAHAPNGKVFRGVIQAASAEEAGRALAKQKLIADSIKPEPMDRSFQLRRTPSHEALVQFTRQFATLVEAAVPLLLSLEIAQGLTDDRVLRRTLAAVAADVNAGLTLAGALRKYPKVFSSIFVNVVEAGEEGGTLDVSLLRLADYMERSQEVRDRVRASMVYPAVIVLVAVGSVAALLTLVVPTFESIFASSGLELPFATQVVVTASRLVGSNAELLLLGVLSAVLVAKAIYGTTRGRHLAHRILLRTPVFGGLARKVAVARLCRTVASLLASGVSILDAMSAGARTSGNAVIEEGILYARERVSMGAPISESLTNTALPDLVGRMVGVGEQTGRLDQMFAKVADFYEREVDAAVDGLLKALEPALVVMVGVILGGMVIAMYLPIFDTITAVDPVSTG